MQRRGAIETLATLTLAGCAGGRGLRFADVDATTPVMERETENESKAEFALRWPVWLGVVCDDLEQQRRFYRDALGLKELRVGDGWVWFDFDGKLLELLAKRPAVPQYDRRRVSFAFEVDDIHAARAEMIRRGVEPVTEIDGGPEVLQYWAYFKDAEGNLFEIVQRIGTATPG